MLLGIPIPGLSQLRLGEQCRSPEGLGGTGGTCRVSLWGTIKYCYRGRLGTRSFEGSLSGLARLPWLSLKGLSQGAAVLFEIQPAAR